MAPLIDCPHALGSGNISNADSDANVRVGNVTGFLVEGNFLGLAATKPDFSTGTTATGGGDNLRIINGDGNGTTTGATASLVQNNLIGYATGKGIGVQGGSTGVVIRNNEIRNNGIGTTNLDGIDIEISSSTVVMGNLLVDNAGAGVDSHVSTGGNTITGNTIIGNGRSNGETAGVRLYGSNNTVKQNVIRDNYGAGIMVVSGTTNNVFSLNSISGNGSVTTLAGGAASNEVGIDLLTTTDDENKGSGTYVSKNSDNKTTTSGANGLLNYPVITQSKVNGTNLLVTGYAPTGAVLEFFVAAADGSGFGEGVTYLVSRTEGSTDDGDMRVGSYSGFINGIDQGSETSASAFVFTIPLSLAQLTALAQSGTAVTATATVAGKGTSEFSGNAPVSPGPLPVELKAFDIVAVQAAARLTWSTASEKNNDHFDMERSLDGRTFERIGQVRGQGSTSHATNYAFTDAHIGRRHQGVVYYRLQQVDTDGTKSYSPVRTVSFGTLAAGEPKLSVFPNPVRRQDRTATLDLSGLPQGTYQATLLDGMGRILGSYDVQGGVSKSVDVDKLPIGTYLVLVRGNGLRLSQRLIKE